MEPADIVLRFLESVGRRSEAEFYISLFRAEPKEQFAAIGVDANVARHAAEAVVLHLRFLAALGLAPVVVLGHFEPTDAQEHAARIHRRLLRAGVSAGLVAAAEGDLVERCRRLMRAGTLPIVTFGATEGATVEERFGRLADLLSGLQTRKFLFLHRPGGLRRDGTLIPIVNLSTELVQLERSRELSRKERAMLAQSRRLVFDLVGHKLTVAITSPLNLLRELFTVKGAGTLLRRGTVIERHGSYDDVDVPRLRQLLSDSFGRVPYESFFDKPILNLYLEQSYQGAAVLQKTPIGAYLTKFAVGREAQGEGLGRDLWDAFAADHPAVFWRARSVNPINEWYTKLADGMCRCDAWTVFWRGMPFTHAPMAIAHALSQPPDLPPAV
jgi:hypothetical protein